MNKKFKEIDKMATKTVVVPIKTLNKIFRESNVDLTIISKSADLFESYCNCNDSSIDMKTYATKYYKVKISTKSDINKPHTQIAGDVLGIKILNWEWVEDGWSIRIDYTNK